jgi:hypothetical protein
MTKSSSSCGPMGAPKCSRSPSQPGASRRAHSVLDGRGPTVAEGPPCARVGSEPGQPGPHRDALHPVFRGEARGASNLTVCRLRGFGPKSLRVLWFELVAVAAIQYLRSRRPCDFVYSRFSGLTIPLPVIYRPTRTPYVAEFNGLTGKELATIGHNSPAVRIPAARQGGMSGRTWSGHPSVLGRVRRLAGAMARRRGPDHGSSNPA